MKRRRLLALIAGVLAAPLSSAQAPPKRVVRIALLGVPAPAEYEPQIAAFRAGLRELGYVEGANLTVESRWAENDLARLPALAAELVRLRPDVLVTSGPGIPAARRATSTIPIVMAAAGDVVEQGQVASLGRPGGNVTGSSFFFRELNAKRLELLKEVLPSLERVGVLQVAGIGLNAATDRAVEEAARPMNVKLQVVEVRSAADYAQAFATLAKGRAQALVIVDNTMLVAESRRIAELAAANRIPAAGFAQIAAGGGLLGYGVDFRALWHRAASFVDRIVKGAKPADLPVEQPARFELVVNLKAAKVLGIAIPQSILLRADRVIE